MQALSLCMIVKNEADVLARCLESAAGLYDELIVVDTGSTDATKSVAARFTDQIFDFPWIDDFSAARNFAFDQATLPHCMWLDADDILLPADREGFLQVKEQALPEADVVMAPYHTGAAQDGAPALSYYRERIVRRSPLFRWSGAVHEAISPAGNVVYTQAAVTHRKEKQGDPDRNLRILQGIVDSGRNLTPREQFYYGRELAGHSRFQDAALVLEQFLTVGWGWRENSIEACRVLATCYTALHSPRRALRALLESLAFDAPRAEVCCDLGALFLNRGDYPAAIRWYEQALNCPRDDRSGAFIVPACYDYLPAIQLCLCWYRLGDREKAAAWNKRAGAARPEDPFYLYNKAFFEREA
ncbi:glycosyltransferase [Pseudoflavonifractor sp. 524-17]|uniref:glycosyltransferase n=1 Tax=Pseudoflavonifractor sp. 524-17 TaxID=2304577 RepID=UPI00137968F8|nr:glycosyltransferase [Pseudoflavonifractor sp. 524-17]